MTEFRVTAGNRRETAGITSLLESMPHLGPEEVAAVRSLPFVHRFVGRDTNFVRDGEPQTKMLVICAGWGMRYATMTDGRRQVLDFVLPGDVVGLHIDSLHMSTCNVTALTSCEIAEIDYTEIANRSHRYPSFGLGLNVYYLREMTTLSDQVLRLGRMTAYERLCHLFLELYNRQKVTGHVTADGTVAFPITQSIVADSLGLSVVHVNRQVMRLRREGLVSLDRRTLTVHDEARLREISGFIPKRISAVPERLVLPAAE